MRVRACVRARKCGQAFVHGNLRMYMFSQTPDKALMFADPTHVDTQAGWPAGQGLIKLVLCFLGRLALLSLLSFVAACKLFSNAQFFLCIFAFAILLHKAALQTVAHYHSFLNFAAFDLTLSLSPWNDCYTAFMMSIAIIRHCLLRSLFWYTAK